MAVAPNTDGKLTRTSNVAVNSTGWTFGMWIRATASENAFRTPFIVEDNTTLFGCFGLDNNSLDLKWYWNAAPGFSETSLFTMSTSVWYYVAVKCISGTQLEVLWRAFGATSLSSSGVLTIGSVTWSFMGILGSSGSGEEWSNGHAHSARLWHAALSTDEIMAESMSPVPVRTANLDSTLTLIDATDPGDDESGNARDWTASGTFATVDYLPVLLSPAAVTIAAPALSATPDDAVANLSPAAVSVDAPALSAVPTQPVSLSPAAVAIAAPALAAAGTQPVSLSTADVQVGAPPLFAGGAQLLPAHVDVLALPLSAVDAAAGGGLRQRTATRARGSARRDVR